MMESPRPSEIGERALLVDLYELTMAASYFAEGMSYPATFDLFFRELPPRRNFLVACGLEEALRYLESLTFSDEDVDYLRSLALFEEPFLGHLRRLRFTGEVSAVPEGEVVFSSEPVLRVTAPLIEAQIVETYLLNCINFSTAIASKAARVTIACRGRPFVDFSARRDHGADASLLAARASFIAGAAATSNVAAGKRFGIPLSGTMAHSYVLAFPDEISAFRAFARQFPGRAVLLIDTFDTVQGAHRAARVASELTGEGIRIRGVRIDSGDLLVTSRQVRKILDQAGHPGMEIFASGDLDEYRIDELVASDAPIDGFGVGTQLGTSADAPFLGGVYKLAEDPSGPKFKRSVGKGTLPGRKSVYRIEQEGRYLGDIVGLADEPPPPGGRGLLSHVMSGGRRLRQAESLAELRQRCRACVGALGERLRSLDPVAPYEVSVTPSLRRRLAMC
ncbi:MAG: nicotinate phosphoribosyltransferase [Actinomycetota bacterium]